MRATHLGGLGSFTPVGAFPKGAARWGHLDMVGDVRELNFDCLGDVVSQLMPLCPNPECACVGVAPFEPGRVTRGGGAADTPNEDFADQPKGFGEPLRGAGVRCARAAP